MTEKERLQQEIKDLKTAELDKREARLAEIYREEVEQVEAKVKRCQMLQDKFTLDELTFSAGARCNCGAGLAYPNNSGMHGSWYCSDILLGRAKPASDGESKTHDSGFPFAFYSIKSENQPSARGFTTRPKE